MRRFPLTVSPAFLLLLTAAAAAALPIRADAAAQPPAGASRPAAAPPRAQVRFDLRLTRADSGAGATAPPPAPAPSGSGAAGPVTVVATPILNTTDLGTASIAITNADLGFTVSLSPTLEGAEKTGTKASVLTLWNLRLSGHSLPGGTSVVTVSGSTRIAPGTEAMLAEVPLHDAKTGQTSLFRLMARATITAGTRDATATAASGTSSRHRLKF